MDFVVVGIILGAVIVGAGELVRTIGPHRDPWIQRNSGPDVDSAGVKIGWNRFCQSLGQLAMTLGLFVLLVTVLATVGHASDDTGKVAVAASTLLALVTMAGCGYLIAGHYRRGGFDPRTPRIEETARLISNPLRLANPVVTSSVISVTEDQIFSIAKPEDVPIETPTSIESIAEVELVGPGTSDPAPPNLIASVTPASEEIVELEIDPNPQPEIDAAEEEVAVLSQLESNQEPNLHVADREPEPVEEWTAYEPALNFYENAPTPVAINGSIASAPVGQVNELPDDLDDELPAWNAPPPPPKPVVAERGRSAPTRSRIATGFESSLFADLEVPELESAQSQGRFASKLLNELTTTDEEPGEPVVDVLLDEFSLPEPERSASSGTDQTR